MGMCQWNLDSTENPLVNKEARKRVASGATNYCYKAQTLCNLEEPLL